MFSSCLPVIPEPRFIQELIFVCLTFTGINNIECNKQTDSPFLQDLKELRSDLFIFFFSSFFLEVTRSYMKYMGEVGFSLDNFIDLYCGTTGGGIPGRWQIEMEIGMNS